VAHEDDDTVIAGYLARASWDEHRRVAVVYVTSGDGGGSEVGNERGHALSFARERSPASSRVLGCKGCLVSGRAEPEFPGCAAFAGRLEPRISARTVGAGGSSHASATDSQHAARLLYRREPSSRHASYAQLAAEGTSFYRSQEGSFGKKAVEAEKFTSFAAPVRFVFGKSVVGGSVTGDIFEGVLDAVPFVPAPGFRPEVRDGLALELEAHGSSIVRFGERAVSFSVLPSKTGQQQKSPRQPLFSRVKQLINQVLLNMIVAGDQIRDKKV
jgi:hypothetical protein